MNDFNSLRKQLLIKLDQKEEVSDLDLGMYDLTPYLKNNFDSTLTEKIINIKNEEHPITHILNQKLFFAPEQQKAFDFLTKNDRCILSAPTSFGKTLIVKEYIYRYKPNCIIYIVPTNALAYELENSFKNNYNFRDYKIFDRKKSNIIDNIDDSSLLFIGTQEKYLEIKDSIHSQINLFIIDEAYKLEDSTSQQRGYKLSESFLDSITKKSEKIFLLSPNASFFGFDDFGFEIFSTTYNLVDKIFTVIENSNFYSVLKQKSIENKTILFCDSPSQINESISALSNEFKDKCSNEFIHFLEKEYHPDWSVIKLLKKNILVHHGQMPKYIQNKMINLFNENLDFNLLIGTNSISEGINTPTKNLFISPFSCKLSKNNLLLKNTIGRAGRLGEYPIGHVFSVYDINEAATDSTNIILSVSNADDLQEIEDSSNHEMINELCNEFSIDEDFYHDLRIAYKFSLNTFRRIFKALQYDRNFPNISNLPYMAGMVFTEYKYKYIDSICIRGVLQDCYKNNDLYYPLNSFNDRINYFKLKHQNDKIASKDNSYIIDNYMRFLYSSLDNYILPIAKIGEDIDNNYPNWSFGNNVLKSIKDFLSRYNKKIINLENYDKYTDEQKKIVSSLKDYGISINNSTINIKMIMEIENQLNVRYSTYDIINAIHKLAKSSEFSTKFQNIIDKYLS